MRPFRAGYPWNDGAKIQLEFHGVIDVTLARNSPETLYLVIVFKGLAEFLATPGAPQIRDRFFVHPEESHRGAIFGSHITDGGPVGDGKRGRAFAKELNKLADDLLLAKHFRDAQDEISRGDALLERAGEIDAHDFRCEKIHRLAEHARFGLDAADTPPDDAKSIDHGRMRVGADKGVRIVYGTLGRFGAKNALGQIFEIDLVNNADARGHHAESLKGLLAPLEKLVPFAIALEFHFEIQAQGLRRSEKVHLHRVVDDEIHRHQRLDDLRIFLQVGDSRAHGCQIDEQRDTGEVLEHNARDNEGNFFRGGRLGIPRGQGLDVLLGNLLSVAVSEHRFQDDADAHG